MDQRAEVQAEKARRRLSEFLRQAWHIIEPETALDWNWHLDAICLHLEAVTRGDIKNLLVTVPPGTTKSITVSVMWPAWTWATSPSIRWLTSSNDSDLSLRDAVAARRLIESPWYQERWGHKVTMTSDQNVKSWYENSARGFRNSTSVGESIVGHKGDILLVDDPDDARKVMSEAERAKVHTWWDQGFYNRVNDPKLGRRVVIAQRTHEEDLIGHIKSRQKNFVELCIPEEFEPDRRYTTPIGWSDPRTEKGELLRPSRFGPEEISDAKNRLADFGYAAQHQQAPTSKEGIKFKRTWFQFYNWHGEYLQIRDQALDWRQLRRFVTCDPAASAKTSADYTVACAWAITPRHDLVCLGCLRIQKEIPDIVPELEKFWDYWKPQYIAIEAVAANDAVFKLANRTKMVVQRLSPGGNDKLVRATPAMVLASNGRVWLPSAESAGKHDFPLDVVIAELTSFSGIKGRDKNDDIVDNFSYSAEVLSQMPAPGSQARPMVLGGDRF